MNKTFSILIFISTLFAGNACKTDSSKTNIQQKSEKDTFNILEHATSIALIEKDSVWSYEILTDQNRKIIEIPKSKLPFQKLAILSSSSIGYLEALDGFDNIEGVFDPQWIYSPQLSQLIENKPEINQGNLVGFSLEKILTLNPDAVIAYSDPNMTKNYKRMEESGITIIYADDFNEKTPLGKAEFLKLYGVLIDKEKQANRLFEEIESNYLTLKNLALSQPEKPTIFADIMRGDIWYMPGGKSFAAQYFMDAGGEYLWHDNSNSGSVKLNFEQVYEKASNADIWMNAADLNSLSQVQKAYIHHDWFDAFQQGNIYSLAQRMNSNGSNDYFETGAVRVDWVLKDLVHIFHPELLPDHRLYFYQKLK